MKILVRGVAVLAIVIGLAVFGFTVLVGDCAAFGGRCPRTERSSTTDDVLGGGAMGGALIGAGAVIAARPRVRALPLAAAAAAAAAVICALMAQSMTSS